ncbi:ORF32 [Ranid herpesvirus 1]|uniref:ORF32 n=1 Tax=Ranid herpesvirus 1 TaxID=85655 RepID=Q14VS6_9VIRU|nr:ORF32 [Ranid herpesvirus 1]ABG25738.1 ORF32 [Ranid herpesvirus 1]
MEKHEPCLCVEYGSVEKLSEALRDRLELVCAYRATGGHLLLSGRPAVLRHVYAAVPHAVLCFAPATELHRPERRDHFFPLKQGGTLSCIIFPSRRAGSALKHLAQHCVSYVVSPWGKYTCVCAPTMYSKEATEFAVSIRALTHGSVKVEPKPQLHSYRWEGREDLHAITPVYAAWVGMEVRDLRNFFKFAPQVEMRYNLSELRLWCYCYSASGRLVEAILARLPLRVALAAEAAAAPLRLVRMSEWAKTHKESAEHIEFTIYVFAPHRVRGGRLVNARLVEQHPSGTLCALMPEEHMDGTLVDLVDGTIDPLTMSRDFRAPCRASEICTEPVIITPNVGGSMAKIAEATNRASLLMGIARPHTLTMSASVQQNAVESHYHYTNFSAPVDYFKEICRRTGGRIAPAGSTPQGNTFLLEISRYLLTPRE